MLTPSAASLARHHTERLSGDRPAQHDDGVGRRFPQHHRRHSAALDRHVEADTVDGGLYLAAQFGPACHFHRTGHEDARNGKRPWIDDLFDVEKLDLAPREHLEQR